MRRAQAPAHVLLLAACAWLSACGLNQAGVDPPSDTIAYPASAVKDRNGDWLFVTNSNADLRYNDGTLIALSLQRAQDDRDSTVARDLCKAVNYPNPRTDVAYSPDTGTFCCRDVLDPNVLDCDERSYVGGDYAIGDGSENLRIGSFAAGMVLQTAACPTLAANYAPCALCDTYSSDEDRLLLGVRGDTSLTFIDVQSSGPTTPPTLKCVGDPSDPQSAGDFGSCDDAHRIVTAPSALASPSNDPNPPDVPLPDEPYALAINQQAGLLFIGHLSGNTARPFTGGFSLFDIAPRVNGAQPSGQLNLEAPRFIGPFPSPFSSNSVGSVGVTALNYENGAIYASSRYTPQVSGLGTTAQCPLPAGSVREIAAFPNGVTYNPPLAGGETRGVQFVNGQAFVLQRSPPALIRFLDQYTPTDVLEACSSPTFLDKYTNSAGETRLFVTCFADGEVYVYDPELPQLVKTFSVGRGPSGLVFDNTHGREVAYVVGFGDNNISVIDLVPGSPTEYHMIQRIGFQRTTPR
jgi:hypothetical protein